MIKILLYILCYSLLYILLLWVCGVFKSPNPTYSCNNTICSKNNTPCDTTSPNCYTNDKCNSKCKSPSDLAKEVIQEWSKKYNSEPFIMMVNYNDDVAVAILGTDSGIIPCDINGNGEWGANPGLSTVASLNDDNLSFKLDTGISQKWQILKKFDYWLIKIPLDITGSPSFNYKQISFGKENNCIGAGLNLWFEYNVTGNYFGVDNNNVNKLFNSYNDALNYSNNKQYYIWPEVKSNSQLWLNPNKSSQVEMGLYGTSNTIDLSGVNAISLGKLNVKLYDSKTGDDLKCTQMKKTSNELSCDYNMNTCSFPNIERDSNNKYNIVTNNNGIPYKCLNTGVACDLYATSNETDKKQISKLWATPNQTLEDRFSFTDSFGTIWDINGCVPDGKYCTNNNRYMGMTLVGNSCGWLNAGKNTLNGHLWVTGSANPPGYENDQTFKLTNCGSKNFGSMSDRLRACKFKIDNPPQTCPINPSGSCFDNTKSEPTDSWASDEMQKYCQNAHNDKCGIYCQSYDDYWGTMTCPVNNLTPSNIIISTDSTSN